MIVKADTANSAAHVPGRFEHRNGHTRVAQHVRRRQAGDAGTDHEYTSSLALIHFVRCRHRSCVADRVATRCHGWVGREHGSSLYPQPGRGRRAIRPNEVDRGGKPPTAAHGLMGAFEAFTISNPRLCRWYLTLPALWCMNRVGYVIGRGDESEKSWGNRESRFWAPGRCFLLGAIGP